MIKNILTIVTLLLVVQNSFSADDIVQITSDGVSLAETPAKARSESLKDAMEKGCIKVIEGLIGESRVDKNLSVIKSRILSQTSKFVPFYKALEPTKKGEETVVSVTMKVSISSLKDLLGQEGLLYQSEGVPTILPVIRIAEKKDGGHVFRWWAEEVNPQNAFLRDQTKMIWAQLDSAFRPKNFYLIDPVGQHYVQWMPEPYRVDFPTLDDLLWMGEYFKAQMVIQGDVTVESTPTNAARANLRLVTYHSSNGRVVADVTRSFDSSPAEWELGVQQVLRKAFGEISKDLVTQIAEEWNRGTLGASLIKLTLRGPLMSRDLELFKSQMTSKIVDVKKIRERRLESGLATFEVDVAGGISNLVKRLEGTSFDGFRVVVDNLDHDEVFLNWSKR